MIPHTFALSDRPVTIDLDAAATPEALVLAACGDLSAWAARVLVTPTEYPQPTPGDLAVLSLRVALVLASLSHVPRRRRRRLLELSHVIA